VRRELIRWRPDLAFNLVESLGGSDRLICCVPALLSVLHVPFTGSTALSLAVTSDKVEAKSRFIQAGIPTPGWHSLDRGLAAGTAVSEWRAGRYIVKARDEHASAGLTDDSVVNVAEVAELERHLAAQETRWRRRCLAEQYIEGREFNVSLLADGGGANAVPVVLPVAEIAFDGYPAAKPRIVGHAAKWQADSFEYTHTNRRFVAPAAEPKLVNELARLARECWRWFGLRGFARVDFRVSERGEPYVLEVNANPCLAPDAGYAAALAEARIPFVDAIARILESARASVVA
jgi:D-alanine-D-alanine ligase